MNQKQSEEAGAEKLARQKARARKVEGKVWRQVGRSWLVRASLVDAVVTAVSSAFVIINYVVVTAFMRHPSRSAVIEMTSW